LNILKKPTLILTLSLCAGIAALSGCGQKGPLYMPTRPAPLSTPKPAATPVPAETATATTASAGVSEEKKSELAPQKK
jgi:predicted small lipoprotein YifL